jgi:hypothetical protein
MHSTYFQVVGTDEAFSVKAIQYVPRQNEIVILDNVKYKVFAVEYEFKELWHESTIIVIEKYE